MSEMKKTIQRESFITNARGSSNAYGGSALPDVVRQRRAKLETMAKPSDIPASPEDDLAIKDVRGWTLSEPVSKREYTVIKIQTASGLSGFGECAPLWAAEYTEAKALILGKPVTSFDVTASLLAKCPTARAALNIAMLDAVGKVCKAPVFQVLGGPTRYRARALAPIEGDTNTALISAMNRAKSAGYLAFKVSVTPVANRNQGQAYVQAIVKRLETLRAAGGQDVDFVLDGASLLTPGDAQMISAAIEKYHVLWFDEPCPPTGLGAFKKISGGSVTCIGLGKQITEGSEVQDLFRENAVDIIRPEIGFNGISQIKRMATIAEVNYAAVGPNHNGGPIGTAAALHLAASIPNFFIQEIPFPEAQEDQAMRLALTTEPVEVIKGGFAVLPVGPGLGININEQSLKKYSEVTL
jgi:galactonate dehydratase